MNDSASQSAVNNKHFSQNFTLKRVLAYALLGTLMFITLFIINNKIEDPPEDIKEAQSESKNNREPSAMPQTPEKFIKYSKNEMPISFSYPNFLTLKENKNYLLLTNDFKVQFNTQKPDIIDVDNFHLEIGRESGTLKSLVNDIPTEKIKIGNNTYEQAYMGAEGSGQTMYYLNIAPNEWVVFTYLSYLDQDINLNDRIKTGYLDQKQQTEIVKDILSKVEINPQNNTTNYTCPKSEWINCMPIVAPERAYECEPEYLQWAKENCPGFEGAAM